MRPVSLYASGSARSAAQARHGVDSPEGSAASPRPQMGGVGAGAGVRTLTPLRAADFKSAAYANSATPARPKG